MWVGRKDFETLENGLCAKKVEKSLAEGLHKSIYYMILNPLNTSWQKLDS